MLNVGKYLGLCVYRGFMLLPSMVRVILRRAFLIVTSVARVPACIASTNHVFSLYACSGSAVGR